MLFGTCLPGPQNDQEIKQRIGRAKTVFGNMKNVLLSHKPKNPVSCLQDYEYYVWPVSLYGCETWTISKTTKKRLTAVEVWFMWRMIRISRTEKISNLEVYRAGCVHIQHTLVKIVKK